MPCILTHIEFVTEFLNDLLRDLTFKDSQKLNILTTIKFYLQDTDRFLFWCLLHWWQSCRSLRLNLWITLLLSCVISWIGGVLEVCTSISWLSGLWLRVIWLLSKSITWNTLCSLIQLLLSVVPLLESGWWLTVSVWDILVLSRLLLHRSSISKRLTLVHITLSNW